MSEQLIGREKQWTCQIFSSCVPDLSKKKNKFEENTVLKEVFEFLKAEILSVKAIKSK